LSCCHWAKCFHSIREKKEFSLLQEKKKMNEVEGKELVNACRDRNWEDARAMIAKNPQLLCTARNKHGYSPAYWAVCHGNVVLLQYMADAIILRLQKENQEQQFQLQQVWRDAFERGTADRWTPAHVAAAYSGSVQCLAFLVEHAPSGAAVLEVKDKYGSTPAHCATWNENVDALDFIVRNAPTGPGVLEMENGDGDTPMELLSSSIGKQGSPRGTTGYLQSTGGITGDLQNYP
jgi:hypothetical protein